MNESVEFLKLTKLDVGYRQAREAVLLFFEDRDPVAVHTLACAAGQIASDLARNAGSTAPLRDPKILTKKNLSDWRKMIKSPENFFKHADRDAEAILEFPPNITLLYLAESAGTLLELGAKDSGALRVYGIWFIMKFGHYNPRIAASELYGYYSSIPGTDLDDHLFFRALIESIENEDEPV